MTHITEINSRKVTAVFASSLIIIDSDLGFLIANIITKVKIRLFFSFALCITEASSKTPMPLAQKEHTWKKLIGFCFKELTFDQMVKG